MFGKWMSKFGALSVLLPTLVSEGRKVFTGEPVDWQQFGEAVGIAFGILGIRRAIK